MYVHPPQENASPFAREKDGRFFGAHSFHGMMVKNSLDNKVLFPGASGKRWGVGGGGGVYKYLEVPMK